MALNLGDTAAGIGYAHAARELDEQLGNVWGVAYSTMMLGNCYAEARGETRDFARARDYLAESAALFDAIGDRFYGLIATNNRAWIVGELGDRDEENRLHREALATAREIGNAGIEAEALAQLAIAARDDGDLAGALRLLRESVAIDSQRAMMSSVATNLGRLASVLVRMDDPLGAARLLGAEEALADRLGAEMTWWARDRSAETLELIRARVDSDSVQSALAEGRLMSTDEAVALALGGASATVTSPPT
jgi:tetratricopeptide (TPR) repeat protein